MVEYESAFVNMYCTYMCTCKSFGLCLRGCTLKLTSDGVRSKLERAWICVTFFCSYALFICTLVYLFAYCELLVYLCISQNNGLWGRILNANCAGQWTRPRCQTNLGATTQIVTVQLEIKSCWQNNFNWTMFNIYMYITCNWKEIRVTLSESKNCSTIQFS